MNEKTLTDSFLDGSGWDVFSKGDDLVITARVSKENFTETWKAEGRKETYFSFDDVVDNIPSLVPVGFKVRYKAPDDWMIRSEDGRVLFTGKDGRDFQKTLKQLKAHSQFPCGSRHPKVVSYHADLLLSNPYMFEMCGRGKENLLNVLRTQESKIIDLDGFYALKVASFLSVGNCRTKSGKIPTYWGVQILEKEPIMKKPVITEEKEYVREWTAEPEDKSKDEFEDELEEETKEKKKKQKQKLYSQNVDVRVKRIRLDLTEAEYVSCKETGIVILGFQDENTLDTIFAVRSSAVDSMAAAFKTNAVQLQRIMKINPLCVGPMIESLLYQYSDGNSDTKVVCKKISRKMFSILGMDDSDYAQYSSLQEIEEALDFLGSQSGTVTNWTVTPESTSVTVMLRKECMDYTSFVDLKISYYPNKNISAFAYLKVGCARVNISEFNSEIDKKGRIISLKELLESKVIEKIKNFQDDFDQMVSCMHVFEEDELNSLFGKIFPKEKMEKVVTQLQHAYRLNHAYRATDLYIDAINLFHKVSTSRQRLLTNDLFATWIRWILNPSMYRRSEVVISEELLNAKADDLYYSEDGEITLFPNLDS